MVENDLVDCMIALPGQLFYTTQIPVCLWFLAKDKSGGQSPSPLTPLPEGEGNNQLRDRRGEVLFIDARKIGTMISRTQKELTDDDIAAIAKTYHAWRGETKDGIYEDQAGFCKSATLADMKKHDFVLTPGRYVGAADIEDDGIPFETKMTEMSQTLYAQMEESTKLDDVIRQNLEGLGYGE
jgi:type I restriction enzyme M protein